MISTGTDGVSLMMGRIGGVFSLIKRACFSCSASKKLSSNCFSLNKQQKLEILQQKFKDVEGTRQRSSRLTNSSFTFI